MTDYSRIGHCMYARCHHARIDPPYPVLLAENLCRRCYQRYYAMVPGLAPICTEPACEQPYVDYGYCEDHMRQMLGDIRQRVIPAARRQPSVTVRRSR